jgi:hypothetical protein
MWSTIDLHDDARATVADHPEETGALCARVGSTNATVRLFGTAETLRRLFNDGLAQIDAIDV